MEIAGIYFAGIHKSKFVLHKAMGFENTQIIEVKTSLIV